MYMAFVLFEELKRSPRSYPLDKVSGIIACAAGVKADTQPLLALTNQVYSLDTTDSSTFRQFFKWVSASVSVGNRSVGTSNDIALPPPPPEIHTVI